MLDFRETFEYCPVVDDLLGGINDWQNIQDIVRLTFKALSDVVKSQGSDIHDLKKDLQHKANKSDMKVALTTVDILQELKILIDSKLSIDDVKDLLIEKISKAE